MQISVSRLNKRIQGCVLLCTQFKSLSSRIQTSPFRVKSFQKAPPVDCASIEKPDTTHSECDVLAQFEQLVKEQIYCVRPSTTRSVNVTRQTATSHNEVRMMNISLYLGFDALNRVGSVFQNETKTRRKKIWNLNAKQAKLCNI